ncbi:MULTISPECIES: hypothetical protein [unclassified Cupriavidus]|uniref:hypothetical protein n=1 Tax=unclassified Cupriavidus TaxID=2640874 RepID=UPI001AE41A2C|nr:MULTISPECIES: hypothetical protein [unclassified Cupriavidus]MBP0630790.1 hypothetical protein [Cupriavidus sp. AcVe19-1a]MBP0640098.1 hypothetical protein [Cupriavidus sp. AcVe19-6a]
MECCLHENSIFRANPDYKLVLVDRLSEPDRRQLHEADCSEDLYGALVPQGGSAQGWRAVSCETALLFTALLEAGPLPRYALRRLGHDLEPTIKRLLLDGVLQILISNEFTCGPQVAELFGTLRSHSSRSCNFDLAVSALRYGQELSCLPQTELGRRLYSYGRKPVSPKLQRRLNDPAAVARFLGIAEEGILARSLHRHWTHVSVSHGALEFWWQWLSKSEPPRETAQRASFKLYLSPVVDDMPEALETLIRALARTQGVTGFKVGVGLWGISRPDKIVVYFAQLDDLYRFADLLRTRLSGCAAHGVPFSAAASENGLLSWGADPPHGATKGERTTSWRMWVTWRLAEYLVSARTAALSTMEPWQYALERLSLAGIDTDTWIPADGMWPAALERA